MKDWQRLALNFKYQDESLVEMLYNEFMAAEMLGVRVPSLIGRPARQDSYDPTPERTAEIIRMFKNGETLEEIGVKFGITRERVRQILKKRAGISRMDGGGAIRRFKNSHEIVEKQRAKKERSEARHFEMYGCSREYIDSLTDLPRTNSAHPVLRFRDRKNNAISRGIDWKLTFKEWWEFWQESGKWEQHGRGADSYCLARQGDTGAYALGNIEIITNRQNGRDFQQYKKPKPQGTSNGVYYMYPGRKNPWLVKHGRKYIGCFGTQEEARAAKDKYIGALQ